MGGEFNPAGWQPSKWLLAQDSHLAWAVAAVFGARAFGLPWWYGGAAILAVAFLKESLFDSGFLASLGILPKENEKQTPTASAVDFLFYCLGVILAFVVLFFSGR